MQNCYEPYFVMIPLAYIRESFMTGNVANYIDAIGNYCYTYSYPDIIVDVPDQCLNITGEGNISLQKDMTELNTWIENLDPYTPGVIKAKMDACSTTHADDIKKIGDIISKAFNDDSTK